MNCIRSSGILVVLLSCWLPWGSATADALEDAFDAGFEAGQSACPERTPGTVIMTAPSGISSSNVGFYWDSNSSRWEAYGLNQNDVNIVSPGRGAPLSTQEGLESIEQLGVSSNRTAEQVRAILDSIQADSPSVDVWVVPKSENEE